MKMGLFSDKQDQLIFPLIVFFWPFIYLLGYVFPGLPFSSELMVDVLYFYYPKVYLLDALSNGQLPLWSPAEACGFPFFASPFGQAIYPLNWPLALYYQINDGFAIIDYQRFSVLGLALSALFLYKWLRSLHIDPKAALFATMVMTVSFRMLVSLNRIHATHAFAWMILILWGLTIALDPQKRKKAFALISIGTFLFLTCAYPYYYYYTIFLFPPYILFLILPQTRTAFSPAPNFNLKQFLFTIIPAFAIPFLLCLPYVLALSGMKPEVINRDLMSMAYAQENAFSIKDTLASLFLPAFSEVRGWFYFGFVALFLLIIYGINHIYPILKKQYNHPLLWGIVLGYFGIITLITYGESPLFKLLWHIMPGFSGFRTWGRLNILWLPFITLLLAKAFSFFWTLLSDPTARVEDFKQRLGRFCLIFLGIYGGILAIQLLLLNFSSLTPMWNLRLVPQYTLGFSPLFYIIIGLIYCLIFTVILQWSKNLKTENHSLKKASTILIGSLLLLNTLDVQTVGTQIRARPVTEKLTEKAIINTPFLYKNAFNVKRAYSRFLGRIYSSTPFSVLHGKYFYYARYTDFMIEQGGVDPNQLLDDIRNGLKTDQERPIALDQLLGIVDGKRLYFSENIRFKKVTPFIEHSQKKEKNSQFDYEIIDYNGDYLELKVTTKQAGYLTFVDNWSKDWYAKVNGKRITIERLFDIFKSVPIKKGSNRIQFFYNPFPFNYVRSFPKPKNDLLKTKEVALKEFMKQQKQIKPINPIDWDQLVGLEQKGDTLISVNTGWEENWGVSKKRLKEEENGSIRVKLHAKEKPVNRAFGFSTHSSSTHFEHLDYAFVLTPKKYITIYEKGIYKGTFGQYKPGDLLRISRIDGQIHYSKMGKLIYTSEYSNDAVLYTAVSFLNKDGQFSEVRSSF